MGMEVALRQLRRELDAGVNTVKSMMLEQPQVQQQQHVASSSRGARAVAKRAGGEKKVGEGRTKRRRGNKQQQQEQPQVQQQQQPSSLSPATWLSYVRKTQLAAKQKGWEKGLTVFAPTLEAAAAARKELEAQLQARLGKSLLIQRKGGKALEAASPHPHALAHGGGAHHPHHGGVRSSRRRRRMLLRRAKSIINPKPVFQLGRSALRYGVGTPVRGAAKVLNNVLVSPVRRTSRVVRGGGRRGLGTRFDEQADLATKQREWAKAKGGLFPIQVCSSERGEACSGNGGKCLELAAIGNRHWALGVKLYDFAMYLNRDSLNATAAARGQSSSGASASASAPSSAAASASISAASSFLMGRGGQQIAAAGPAGAGAPSSSPSVARAASAVSSLSSPSSPSSSEWEQQRALLAKDSYYDDIVRSRETGLSVVLVPARNIPLRIISAEYEKILKRRVTKVGGSASDDPSVHQVIGIFHEDQFPRQCLEGSSIKKGTVLTFVKNRDTLSATADGTPLGQVRNANVCSAFFDMYMGSEPVDEGARYDLGLSAIQLAAAKRGGK